MATDTFVEIDLPEARDLADLTGIQIDLLSARDFARMLQKEFESKRPNWDLVDPLSTAILVRYSRAFVTGVRMRLEEDALQTLSGPQREEHRRLRAFRDKHISHSVNAFEDNQPIARYWMERVTEEGVTSVECNHTRILGLSSADVESVIELTTALLSHVDARLASEKAKVLEIVRKMPLDDLLSKGRRGPQHLNLEDVHKSRKR
jgi:hypothetical protein